MSLQITVRTIVTLCRKLNNLYGGLKVFTIFPMTYSSPICHHLRGIMKMQNIKGFQVEKKIFLKITLYIMFLF